MIKQKFTLFGLMCLLGCSAPFQYGAPWNTQEGKLFDDGIDLMDDTTKLSGHWAFQAESDIDARANLANMIGIVTITSVQTNKTVSDIEEKRIQVEVKQLIYGSAPTREITLKSNADALGYALLSRHENHLKGNQLVFVRWFKNPDGSPGHHFHLSPASPKMISKITALVEKRKEAENAAGK